MRGIALVTLIFLPATFVSVRTWAVISLKTSED